MTSLKLLLILTDNYNTYLTMNRSRTCVDWFLTFKAKKKKNILRLTVIIVIKLISKVKKSEIYKVKKQTAGLTVLEV